MSRRVLVLIKPDAVYRGLIGEIIKHFENKGFEIKDMKFQTAFYPKLEKHYEEHKHKDFYDSLLHAMGNKNIVAIDLERDNAIDVTRNVVLKKIREEYALENPHNSIHASDSEASYEKEVKIWFDK